MEVTLGLVGAGMFGGNVHLRVYSDLQRAGLAPFLGRLGLGGWARDLAPITFKLVAIATRTEQSARAAKKKFQELSISQSRLEGPGGADTLPQLYWGEQPWLAMLKDFPGLDVLAVATPDHLHTPVILAGLGSGTHVISEKPLCLSIQEADEIIGLAERQNRIVGLDMHKRYDPDHLRIRQDLLRRIGEPLHGLAYLEEPLEVSTRTFKWAEQSDPFSYVGSHWVDLIYHYYRSKPVSLTAVGQKKRLSREGINAYDAVQVRVDFQNGMSVAFHNNWITPRDFEGPVNQGHELLGTEGKIESDQQYRGLRWWQERAGSRTANTHFTREVPGPGRSKGAACIGYGADSISAIVAAVCRYKFFGATLQELAAVYPNVGDARVVVGILHAARLVMDMNYAYLQQGNGATVAARFGADGITIVDPNRSGEGPHKVFQSIYSKAL